MFSAFLLNIFAIIIPLTLIFVTNIITKPNIDNGKIGLEFENDYSRVLLLAIVCIGIIIFIIGFMIFFLKNKKLQKILAMLYLILAVLAFCFLFGSISFYVVTPCGFSIFLFIPGILQIIAGIKYVSSTRI